MQYFFHRATILFALLLVSAAFARSSAAQQYPNSGMAEYPSTYPSTSTAASMAAGHQQSMVPGPPTRPTVASRPTSWPGGQGECSPWVPPSERVAPTALVPQGEIKPCDGTRILGRVGSEAILESEVAGAVNKLIEKYKDRIPPDQLDQQREVLIQQRLKGILEMKLIYQDAKRSIPAEGYSQVEKQLSKQFEENELDRMMKEEEVNSRHQLDQKLRALGTSLEREKRAFIELSLAREWVRQQMKRDEEVPHDQVVVYYRDHLKDFTTPARVQWEELMVRFSKYPTRAAAYEAIARMGNQVLAGAPLAEVAKAGSDGTTAGQGGQRDWTAKGSLECQALDTVLFSLPLNQMSQIIEGPRGYHIVRATKREEKYVKPFLEAQVEIKQKIVEERSKKQFRDYMAKLEARTPVWTIFDSDISNPQLSNRPQQSSQR